MKRGTQVKYVPDHAYGDLEHTDVDDGFITSVNGEIAWVRFWFWGRPDKLRKSSVPVPFSKLVAINTRPQSKIDELLEEM